MAATVTAWSGKMRSQALKGWLAAMARLWLRSGGAAMSSKRTRSRPVLLGVADVVEDDELEAVIELGERGPEDEVAPGGLELLHEIGGAGVEDAAAGFDESVADGAERWVLPAAAVADGDAGGAGLDPVAARGASTRARHGGQSLEVEGRQRLAARQARLERRAECAGSRARRVRSRRARRGSGWRATSSLSARSASAGRRAVEARQAQRCQHGGQRGHRRRAVVDLEGAVMRTSPAGRRSWRAR